MPVVMTATAPCRIEIVGVAGSGKSTLTRALMERDARWQLADHLHTRVPAHWPYVAHSIPRVLPLVATTAHARPLLSWDEVKFLIYVSEWSRFLRVQHASAPTVLDQGPVFALACLLWGGKPLTRTGTFRRWLNEMVESWSRELRAIVRLVAPEEILLERINGRDQRHEAKGRARRESVEVLESHERAYCELFDVIDGLGRPPVLCFDTSTSSAVDVAGTVAARLEGGS